MNASPTDDLSGRLVAGVVNFPPRQIGRSMSEVLTFDFPDADGKVVLVTPDREVPIGGRLFWQWQDRSSGVILLTRCECAAPAAGKLVQRGGRCSACQVQLHSL